MGTVWKSPPSYVYARGCSLVLLIAASGEPFADARRALALFGPADARSSVSNDDKVLFCAQYIQFVLMGGTGSGVAPMPVGQHGAVSSVGVEHALVGVAGGGTGVGTGGGASAKVVVFTNDRNMANRAMINRLSVCDRTSRPRTPTTVLDLFASAAEMDAPTYHAACETQARGTALQAVRDNGPDRRRDPEQRRLPDVRVPDERGKNGGPKVFCSCSLFPGTVLAMRVFGLGTLFKVYLDMLFFIVLCVL